MTLSTTDTRRAWGTALLRVAVGIIFVAHGAQKLFEFGPDGLAGFFASVGIPFAAFNAYFIITLELLGGIAMIAGLGTRILGALFAAVMVVAFATVHGAHGFYLPDGYEFVMLVFAASVALVLQGAGAFAVDNVLAGRRLRTHELSPARA